uniref:NADP-dependent oxidoreductase domain-containing protein n=1 Tax=Bicosoecida sp. CB-2014 TaxID=1486930 RepID=A0A7S1CE49_9STRA|mmetsp:Transcript_23587/g.82115  ORF Transcript_23587/g.82115 Transcript_23587/m.82115 type:complete len:353 (+) Transcript_23587:95-1153(+)
MRHPPTVVAALAAAACAACAAAAGVVPPFVELKNAAQPGVFMPVTGLGTGAYGMPNGTNGEYWDDAVGEKAVGEWLRMGGRRIDTSLKWYNDLAGVGRAVAAAVADGVVTRDEVFVTSKVDDPYGYNTTMQHWSELLETSGLDYVDLLLIHWPGPTYFLGHHHNVTYCHLHGPECRRGTWAALTEIFHSGKARAIGTANFEQRHLEDILTPGALVPAVNQLEFHPYWHEDVGTDSLKAFMDARNITYNGYAPLGAPDFMAWHPEKWPTLIPAQPAVATVAAAHGVTPAQVLQRWSLQRGVVINPRSRNTTHMAENLAVVSPGFELSDAEMAAIAAIPAPKQNKVCPDPHLVP